MFIRSRFNEEVVHIIYIDGDFKCHTVKEDGFISVETSFFDGKCDAFIDGYRFVPAGKAWTRNDGVVFAGEMAFPWKPYAALDAAQREYERQQYNEARAAYMALESGLNSI